MSLFLGPIHFWLYDKIKNQEEFTKETAKHFSLGKEYTKVCPPLEEVIDENNIHQSLQAMIDDAETRYAKLLFELRNNQEQLILFAKKFGEKYQINENATPEQCFKYFEDFFVNGMPCDRVNSIIRSGVDFITWKQNVDIHEKYFTPLNMSTDLYYKIRTAIMNGMLKKTKLIVEYSDNTYTVKPKIKL